MVDCEYCRYRAERLLSALGQHDGSRNRIYKIRPVHAATTAVGLARDPNGKWQVLVGSSEGVLRPKTSKANFRIETGLLRGMRSLGQERRSRHYLARLTVAALRHINGHPGLLKRV
jgi:hypothetical protein